MQSMQNKLVDVDGDQGKLGGGGQGNPRKNANLITVDPVEMAKSSAPSKRSKGEEEK